MTPDINNRGGSRVANRNRGIGNQQLPVPDALTLTPGHGSGRLWSLGPTFIPVPTVLQGQGHTHGSSVDSRSEQLGRNVPDHHSAERGSQIRSQRKHEDQGPGVQQSSETGPERTFDGGQDGGDTHDLVQSGRSRGKSRCSGYAKVRIDHH